MASDVQKLRETIDGIAAESRKMVSGLQRFDASFSKSKSQVNQVLAGTTRNTDKQVIQAIDEADRAVKNARQKLEDAAKTASDYGRTL